MKNFEKLKEYTKIQKDFIVEDKFVLGYWCRGELPNVVPDSMTTEVTHWVH